MNVKKCVISLFCIVLALCFSVIGISAEETSVAIQGDGTDENPYLITTEAQLFPIAWKV